MAEPWLTALGGWLGSLAVAAAFWIWSLRRRDAGVADIAWGLLFVALAAWYRIRGPAAAGFHLAHLGMVTVWGVRLAAHIGARARGQAEDRRYAAMRKARGESFARVSLVTVFGLQATLAFLLSAPLWAVQSASTVSTPWFLAGALLWAAGLLCEAVADRQLARFRADPANAGRVLDRGLWRWSRHPNYFGEALLGWGYGLMAVGTGAAWTLVAPAAMTWLLLRVSGVTLLERTMADRRPAYRSYVRRTSAFVPWPPREHDAGDAAG